MTEIQARIQRLENPLAYVAKESRMDPEGSRRDGAKRMLVHLPYGMKKIEQEIARHRNQIRQLQA